MTSSQPVLHDMEAEAYVLGCAIIFPGESAEAFALTPEHFYDPFFRATFQALRSLYDDREGIDIVSVRVRAAGLGHSNLVTPELLVSIVESVPSVVALEFNLEILHGYFLKRAILAAIRHSGLSSVGPEDIAKKVSDLQLAISQIGLQKNDRARTYREIESNAVKSLTLDINRRRLLTGLRDVDFLTNGLFKGELIYLAARPSMGKTSFSRTIARSVASAGNRVLSASLEVTDDQTFLNDVCSVGEIDTRNVRSGRLDARQLAVITEIAGKVKELPITVVTDAPMTVAKLRSHASRMRLLGGLDLIVVDYLQLMSGGKTYPNQNAEIEDISRGLKLLASEFEVPLLCLSQLNRSLETRDDKRPRLSDLRGSGAIEQDADMVMFLYRPAVYADDPSEEDHEECHVNVAKNRNGVTGTKRVRFQRRFVTFTDWEIQSAPTYEEVHQWQNA